MSNIHHDLTAITDVAKNCANKHDVNYNIIIKNADENGEFSLENGSTYEFVTDSYFEKERPRCVILAKTDDLLYIYSEEWQPYTGDYDKYEYDIKLKSGHIAQCCYPNAGKFNSLYDDRDYEESEIEEIRYAEYQMWNINPDRFYKNGPLFRVKNKPDKSKLYTVKTELPYVPWYDDELNKKTAAAGRIKPQGAFNIGSYKRKSRWK